jgi:hypothetical protein
MSESNSLSQRRDFLGGIAATAAAIGLGDLVPSGVLAVNGVLSKGCSDCFAG